LKNTINTMVDQLSSFADEVTRVAKEVGTEGKLGGQAQVQGVSGVWEGLTDNVNQLAATLTTQLRAIAEVSTAVTQGDLTRQISVSVSCSRNVRWPALKRWNDASSMTAITWSSNRTGRTMMLTGAASPRPDVILM